MCSALVGCRRADTDAAFSLPNNSRLGRKQKVRLCNCTCSKAPTAFESSTIVSARLVACRGCSVRAAAAAPAKGAAAGKPATITDGMTFISYLLKQEMAGNIDSEMVVVLSSIATACKQIASPVQRAGISNMTGLAGAANVQGEDQKKLDVLSNDVFCAALRESGRTAIIASEEEDVPVAVEETYSGQYIVVFDPLDGIINDGHARSRI